MLPPDGFDSDIENRWQPLDKNESSCTGAKDIALKLEIWSTNNSLLNLDYQITVFSVVSYVNVSWRQVSFTKIVDLYVMMKQVIVNINIETWQNQRKWGDCGTDSMN